MSSRLGLLCAALFVATVGCREPYRGDTPARDAGPPAMDVGPSVDTGPRPPRPDAGPIVDSGCPAPASIGPGDVGSRYLAPMPAELIDPVDGDTARVWTMSGEQTLRFLHVNTEESGGPEETAFGRYTSFVVETWMREARRIDVTPQNDRGSPDLDPYARWLTLVFLDGELLQTRIVREGLSAYYTEFGCANEPVHSALLNAEAEARANQRGIWRPDHPTDYRPILDNWIDDACRPNPFLGQPYCR